MRTVVTDGNLRELTTHGTAGFPVEINHDDLCGFQSCRIRRHWHPEMEISIVRQGQACYEVGSDRFALEAGEGIFINAGVPHGISPQTESPTILTTFIVHPAFLYGSPDSILAEELFRPLANSGKLSVIRLRPETTAAFLQIEALNRQRPFGYALKVKGLFCEGFYSLLSPYAEVLRQAPAVREQDMQTLDQILQILHRTYSEPLNLQTIASQTAMSKEGCCRFFKRMTGQTLSQYLENYRVSQSLNLLSDGKLPILQIAAQVGFSNAGRFSAAFQKRMGCTPRQYSQRLG